MIAKKYRFHGHGSLKYVFTHGKTVRSPHFGIRFVANKRRQDYRLAVIVSKKVAPLAVTRNRIRRRLFEQMRLSIPSSAGAVDMALVVYDKALLDLSAEELEETVNKLLSQIVKKAV